MELKQQSVENLSAQQLRELATRLLMDVRHKQAVIDKLTHENALLKRLKFAAQSERYSAEQKSLLDETLDADLQAVSEEIEQNASPTATPAATSNNPNDSRCRPTCRAARSVMSPSPPPVVAAAR